jgi:hypothetical protein
MWTVPKTMLQGLLFIAGDASDTLFDMPTFQFRANSEAVLNQPLDMYLDLPR